MPARSMLTALMVLAIASSLLMPVAALAAPEQQLAVFGVAPATPYVCVPPGQNGTVTLLFSSTNPEDVDFNVEKQREWVDVRGFTAFAFSQTPVDVLISPPADLPVGNYTELLLFCMARPFDNTSVGVKTCLRPEITIEVKEGCLPPPPDYRDDLKLALAAAILVLLAVYLFRRLRRQAHGRR